MSPGAHRLLDQIDSRARPRRRRRPRLRRASARGRIRSRRLRHDRHRRRPAKGRRRQHGDVSYIPDVPTADVSRARRRRTAAARPPTSPRSPSSTRSTSACRRRCGRRRTPTCPSSRRPSKAIAEHLHPGMLVILESTTYPGTTDEFVLPLLEASGLKVRRDFFLAFSPERVDPGNPTFNTRNVPKVVGGIDAGVHRAGRARSTARPSSASCPSARRTWPRW